MIDWRSDKRATKERAREREREEEEEEWNVPATARSFKHE